MENKISSHFNSLERWVTEQLLPLDPKARPTRGSGCGNEIGDISNRLFFIECKQKLTKKNIILDRKIWEKHLKSIPISTSKIPIYVTENSENERFVILDAKDFFNIIKQKENK